MIEISRRGMIGGASAAAMLLPFSARVSATDYARMTLAPPITRDERTARLARARTAMQRSGIGAVLVESGPSLEYFTGIKWSRSERLTGAVIPAQGDAIIVTPFFEAPTIREMLDVPAEIRTWQEDEEPLKLVADFLRERQAAASPRAAARFVRPRASHDLTVLTGTDSSTAISATGWSSR